MREVCIEQSAVVEPGAVLGEGTRIWHHAVVRSGAKIGRDCALGQNVYVAGRAVVGDGCRLQNNVSVFDGVTLGHSVFCGPGMTFTNVKRPRAAFPTPSAEFVATQVGAGASLGAGCVVVAGVTVGRWALVGAGAVVTASLPDHALAVGVPARQVGWVCVCGETLTERLDCPACGRRYVDGPVGLCPAP